MRLTPSVSFRMPQLRFRRARPTERAVAGHDALLAVSLKGEAQPPLPDAVLAQFREAVKKDRRSRANIRTATVGNGTALAAVQVDPAMPAFGAQDRIRRAVAQLLEKNPRSIGAVLSAKATKTRAAEQAAYVLAVNGAHIAHMKTSGTDGDKACSVAVYGCPGVAGVAEAAQANVLARALTDAPGNLLEPAAFGKAAARVARSAGLACTSLGKAVLQRTGAGAFLAVANSTPRPAEVVHLNRQVRNPRLRVALIGKGICFDTGGYNLKPAVGMRGMHGDMAGAAVALAACKALAEIDASVDIDCWLGLAENHISPDAIRPGDVIRTHSGKTVEIVDTDAEGRLVLADLLSMATRAKRAPDVAITFATLTGSMIHALGKRYSGLFATHERHAQLALEAGVQVGERMCRFPMDRDYHAGLKSKVADILQCSVAPEADHIMAARFLSEFVERKIPWIHIDLSAASCPGGLGAVSSSTTGFGAHWAIRFVSNLAGEAKGRKGK